MFIGLPMLLGVAGGATAGVAIVAGAICLPGMLLTWAMGMGLGPGAGLTIVLAIPALAIYAAVRGPQRRAEELAQAGLCGACGYPLENKCAATDEPAVCPECGAAWRIPGSRKLSCPNCETLLTGACVNANGEIDCGECASAFRVVLVDASSPE